MKCETKGCRKEYEITVLGKHLCWDCWAARCNTADGVEKWN